VKANGLEQIDEDKMPENLTMVFLRLEQFGPLISISTPKN